MSLPDRTWAEMGTFLFICTEDEAMAGKREGFQAIIQRVSPNTDLAHCVMHREALASRQISPELNKNYLCCKRGQFNKNKSLKARLFSTLCEEIGAECSVVLLHSEATWLLPGVVLSL